MIQGKLVCKLLLCLVCCLLLISCKKKVSGVYWSKKPNPIELELRENSYEFYERVDQSTGNTDIIMFKRVSFLKGTFSIKHNILNLYDSINHKSYFFEIQNDECLICKSVLLHFKPNDTLDCKVKLYSNGNVKWEEGSGDSIFIRSYYNRKGSMIKEVYYDRKRNIVKVKKFH